MDVKVVCPQDAKKMLRGPAKQVAGIESAELAERPNQKTIRFLSAPYSVFFLLQIVAFILRVPSRPLLPFWAEHAFFALFRSWGLAIL